MQLPVDILSARVSSSWLVVAEVGDDHLAGAVLIGGVVKHADVNLGVALALLRRGVADLLSVLPLEVDAPLALGLYFERHLIAVGVESLKVGGVEQ